MCSLRTRFCQEKQIKNWLHNGMRDRYANFDNLLDTFELYDMEEKMYFEERVRHHLGQLQEVIEVHEDSEQYLSYVYKLQFITEQIGVLKGISHSPGSKMYTRCTTEHHLRACTILYLNNSFIMDDIFNMFFFF